MIQQSSVFTALDSRPPTAPKQRAGGSMLVTFKLASYDPSHPLIIDPVLVYSIYLGGSTAAPGSGIVGEPGYEAANDQAYGIAVDTADNVYVTGETLSGNFPTANPVQTAHGGGGRDAFVTKLNATGTALVWSTFLGGSGNEYGFGIDLDSQGNVYVAGSTESSNFPLANAFQTDLRGGNANFPGVDAFVTKLNPSGSTIL